MKRAFEGGVRRWWAGEAGLAGSLLSVVTWPLGLLYGGVVRLRSAAFDRGWLRVHRVEAPVVSVGNLVVGGTGKTPVAAWLAGRLQEDGHRPALVARGYGRDELLLHRRWNPGVPIHADPDRVAAARAAVHDGADVVVADDAFQHRRLARDVDLVLVAAEHPLPGRLLPRGPYREPASGLGRADGVLVTHRTASAERVAATVREVRRLAPDARVGRVMLRPAEWTRLDGSPASPPRGPVLVVTSVAGPAGVRALVATELEGPVDLLAFPDHHAYDPGDAREVARMAAERTVVTTEKDAVKLEALAEHLPDVRVLTLAVEPGPGTSEVLDRVRRSIGAAGTSSLPPAAPAPHDEGGP